MKRRRKSGTARGLRRFALLGTLLPALLVLGLGRGVVVCAAPGGHWELELSGSPCCADRGGPLEPGSNGGGGAAQGPDCGSCSDVRLASESRLPRGAGETSLEPSDAAGAVAAAFPALHDGPARGYTSLDRARAPGRVAPHLHLLRTVRLRC